MAQIKHAWPAAHAALEQVQALEELVGVLGLQAAEQNFAERPAGRTAAGAEAQMEQLQALDELVRVLGLQAAELNFAERPVAARQGQSLEELVGV